MIEPTNICNLKCPLCPTGQGNQTRIKGILNYENFKKIITPLSKHLISVRFWNWGEPLLNKEIGKIIRYTSKRSIRTILSTNASFLTPEISKTLVESKLDELIISLDGASEETYNTYRKNGDFNTVIESIKTLVNQKKELNSIQPHIQMQFIIMKHNEHEIENIKIIAKRIGVDELILKTVGPMDSTNIDEFKKYLPKNPKLRRKQFKDENEINKNEICKPLYTGTTINWNGDVTPCCFDFNGNFVMGNVFETPFNKIWKNKKYQSFRKIVFKNKKNIPMCKFCSSKMDFDYEHHNF